MARPGHRAHGPPGPIAGAGRGRWWAVAVSIVLLIAGVTIGASVHPGPQRPWPYEGAASGSIPTTSAGMPRPALERPAATTDPIYVDGYSPTAIALHWDTTHDLCFDHYGIELSTSSSSGPWMPVWNTTDSARYEFMMVGFAPGTQTWWRDVDYSGCAGGQAASNVVNITNPPAAALSYGDSSSTSILLAWTNHAHYYGLLSFTSYVVMRSVGAGAFAPVATITSPATTTFTDTGLAGLNAGARYQYYVVTYENCSGTYCAGLNASTSSASNRVAQLSLTPPVASPSTLRVNESTSLQVAVFGGTGPYRFAWTGLPPGCVITDTNPLACTPSGAGSFAVSVSVTDGHGITIVSKPVTLTVSPPVPPGNGSGNGSVASKAPVGLPSYAIPLVLAALAAVAIGAGLILYRRRRRRQRMPSIAFAPASGPGEPPFSDLSRSPPEGRRR